MAASRCYDSAQNRRQVEGPALSRRLYRPSQWLNVEFVLRFRRVLIYVVTKRVLHVANFFLFLRLLFVQCCVSYVSLVQYRRPGIAISFRISSWIPCKRKGNFKLLCSCSILLDRRPFARPSVYEDAVLPACISTIIYHELAILPSGLWDKYIAWDSSPSLSRAVPACLCFALDRADPQPRGPSRGGVARIQSDWIWLKSDRVDCACTQSGCAWRWWRRGDGA